jgi:hypothetical protein
MTRPIYDAAVRVRRDILDVVTRELRDVLHNGGTLPVADMHSAIDQMIEDYGNERARDAISEYSNSSNDG